MTDFGVVLRGGRVIDPETSRDEICDVAIAGDTVAAVGGGLPAGPGTVELDATGLVVTAGFVDLHSHTTGIAGNRLRALDGVTTALELESGVTPVARAYEACAAEGRPINYGFAASWAMARMEAVAGVQLTGRFDTFLANISDPAWQRAATAAQVTRLLARLDSDLADGAIGIGLLMGYAPGTDPGEYLQVAALAARAGAPTFTHSRDITELAPGALIDGAEEIVRAAGETGAAMHYCHINSTSLRHIGRVHDLIARARSEGSRVSTEAYPYGSGMTGIGAAFLAPERLHERNLQPADITYAPTGERLATVERLRQLRRDDPGGLAILKTLDEDVPADLAFLLRALTFPDAIVASDAMPLTWQCPQPDEHTWPLPDGAFTHPRTAGTYARALRLLASDGDGGPVGSAGPLGLTETLRRSSLLPAQLLEDRVPAMRRKGRLKAGCDADIVVFDPATISSPATYLDSTRPSTGVRHVLVNGTFVVCDGEIVPDALPGRPIRA